MSPGATHVAPAGPDVQNVGLAAPEGEGARSPGPGVPARVAWRAAVAIVPGLALAAYAAHVLTGSSTPTEDIGSYALYWALCVVVPGTLVFKATRGSAGSWLADLALGATTGLALELAAWAVASSLDLRDQLRFWPVLALALLVGRRTRGRVLARPSQPWSLPAVAVVAAAVAQVVWHVDRTFLQVVPLPPTGRFYYPDLLWHLGLVNEATRSFPLGTPQVVDAGLLVYHWFSDAHIAAASLISGVDTTTALLRLWILPVVALTVTLTAVLTRRVGGSDWAAAGAAALVSTTMTVPFWPSMWTASDHLNPQSPSQQFSMPLTLLLVYAIVELVQAGAGSRRGPVVLVVVAALATSGTKSSALPLVLGGAALAAVAALALRRGRRTLLVLLGALATLTAVAQQFVAGGAFGAGFQLFSVTSMMRPYLMLRGPNPDFHTPVLAGVVDTPGVGPLLLVGLLLIAALTVLRLLSLFLPIFQRTLRRDPSAWLLSGICLAALGPYLGLGHVGFSEVYFVFGALPFGCVLTMWALSDLVRDNARSARVTVVAGAGAAVVTLWLGWNRLHSPVGSSRSEVLQDLTWFVVGLATAALVILVALGVALLLRRRGDARWVPAPLAVMAAMAIAGGPLYVAVSESTDTGAARPREYAVALAESTAAVWVKQNVPLDAVMATNAHCRDAVGAPCLSRQWWISGLGGRQVLVDGWDYLPTADDGFPDQELLRLNQAAFEDPSSEAVRRLRDRGVTWLVAETVPNSRPSGRLGQFARERYRDGPIVIYELTEGR